MLFSDMTAAGISWMRRKLDTLVANRSPGGITCKRPTDQPPGT